MCISGAQTALRDVVWSRQELAGFVRVVPAALQRSDQRRRTSRGRRCGSRPPHENSASLPRGPSILRTRLSPGSDGGDPVQLGLERFRHDHAFGGDATLTFPDRRFAACECRDVVFASVRGPVIFARGGTPVQAFAPAFFFSFRRARRRASLPVIRNAQASEDDHRFRSRNPVRTAANPDATTAAQPNAGATRKSPMS